MTSSTTAIAEARPTLWNLKAIWTVWMTKVSLPFAPPVMMNGISNTDSEPGDRQDERQADDAAGCRAG